MRVSVPVFGLMLSSVVAQNPFEIFPQRPGLPAHVTTYTRLTLGLLAGEILMEVPDYPGHDFFRGIGRDCTACRIRAVEVRFQDLNRRTPESFRVVLRSNLATGGPDMTPLGVIFASPWAFTPVIPGVGPIVLPPQVVSFPCNNIPCTGGFSIGVELTATVAGDGLYVASAAYSPLLAVTGDYPKAAAPSYAWSDPAGIPPLVVSLGDALGIAALTCDAPVLNMGNIAPPPRLAGLNPSFGVGGMWPDMSPRGDGLSCRIKHAPHASGFSWLAISPAWAGIPLNLGFAGMCEDFHLELQSTIFLALGMLDGSGEIQATLLPPLPRAFLLGNSAVFQGFTADSLLTPPIRVTNAQKVQF